MKRSRPPRPGVREPPGRPGMSQNGPARRSYGNAAGRHLPPSRGRPDQGLHSLPEEAQPGTVPRPPPRYPRASQPRLGPGSTAEGIVPSLRRTQPTPTPMNTQLRKYRSARWVPRSAGTRRYAPAEPSGSWTRRGNPGGIRSGMRRRHTRTPPAASIGSPRSPRTGPASSSTNPEDSGYLTAGARAAALRHSVETGAVVKVQGTVTAVNQAGAKFAVTGPSANQEDLRREGAPVYLGPADWPC